MYSLEHRAAHALSHLVYAHLQLLMLYGILTILYEHYSIRLLL